MFSLLNNIFYIKCTMDAAIHQCCKRPSMTWLWQLKCAEGDYATTCHSSHSLHWDPGSEQNVRSQPPVALCSLIFAAGRDIKSLQSINRKGQTQMFPCKTDDTKSLVEYPTSGICFPVTTSPSIFQPKEISSITVTVQHGLHMATGREMKVFNIKRRVRI